MSIVPALKVSDWPQSATVFFASSAPSYDETVVGQGAFCVVHRARWCGVNVAIKKFTKGRHFKLYNAFDRELSIHSLLRHPYIVLLLSAGTTPVPFMMMEYFPHRTLRDLIKQSPRVLNREVGLRLTSQVLGGLMYLHSCNIYHRDLRTRNVMITSNLIAKIGDFNLSSRFEEPLVARGALSWCAPEVLQDPHQFSPASDVYSFAILMYEIVEKKLPVPYYEVAQAVNAVVKECARPIFSTECDHPLRAAIEKSWSPVPSDRMSLESLAGMIEELTEEYQDSWNKPPMEGLPDEEDDGYDLVASSSFGDSP